MLRRHPPASSLPDLPPCFSAPMSGDCSGHRPDIPLRNSFLSQLRRQPAAAASALAVDVGANDGAWSYWLRTLANRHAPRHPLNIVMFDPQKRVAGHLQRLAAASNVTFLQVAAWTRGTLQQPEVLDFFSTASSKQSSLSFSDGQGARKTRAKHAVPAIDLAAWLAREASTHSLLMLKIDVEGTEYQLLPHLLARGVLCLPTHLIIEWHLNYLPPERRLAALALRLSLNSTLRNGCARPPTVVHEEDWHNNRWKPVPGLTALVAAHNTERQPREARPRNVEYPVT